MALTGKLDTNVEHQNIYPTFDQAKLLGIVPQSQPKIKSGSTRVKRWRCMQCDNCQKSDCGRCEHCLDKVKFGGKNKKRKPCVMRACLSMQEVTKHQVDSSAVCKVESASTGPDDLISKLKSLFDDPDDEAYWKEFCEAPDVNDGKKEVKIEEPNPVDVKVYMCKHCDATYTKNGSLYAHVRNKHKLTNV